MKTENITEYFLLRNYLEYGLIARGNLLNLTDTALDLFNNNSLLLKVRGKITRMQFNKSDQDKLRSTLQLDIITKIMMYVEDFIILAESFRQKRNFYDIITSDDPKDDIGNLLKTFFDSIENLSEAELKKMLSYGDETLLDLSENEKTVLNKILQGNMREFRRILIELRDFSRTHHPIWKRYKHAGFPYVPGLATQTGNEFLKQFPFTFVVFTGKDPLKDNLTIPYSDDVIEGYRIIFDSLQNLILDLLSAKIGSLERELDAVFPNVSFAPDSLSKAEWETYSTILKKFEEKYPFQESLQNLICLHQHQNNFVGMQIYKNFLMMLEKEKMSKMLQI